MSQQAVVLAPNATAAVGLKSLAQYAAHNDEDDEYSMASVSDDIESSSSTESGSGAYETQEQLDAASAAVRAHAVRCEQQQKLAASIIQTANPTLRTLVSDCRIGEQAFRASGFPNYRAFNALGEYEIHQLETLEEEFCFWLQRRVRTDAQVRDVAGRLKLFLRDTVKRSTFYRRLNFQLKSF